jgi:DNA-binding NarL/FixJ family response regulator
MNREIDMRSHGYKVLIAEDHRLVAELCKSLLEAEFDVVGIVNNGRELIRLALDLRPDVAVVDISMPIMNGLDAGERLKEVLPNMKLVYLTMHRSEELAAEAMVLGASGYVVKTCAASELMHAVRRVLQGKSYLCSAISKDTVDILVRERKSREKYRRELTSRQRDVLRLIAEGRPTKEVGVILGLSIHTVAFHKKNMREALGLKTTAELIHYAVRSHMVGSQVRAEISRFPIVNSSANCNGNIEAGS